MNEKESGLTFGVEVATVEEFLRLLRERGEGRKASAGSESPINRAVFVACLQEVRSSRHDFPKTIRYAVAIFVGEEGMVCLRKTTSSAVELPEAAGAFEERQRTAFEELLMEVQRGLKEADLGVPLHGGSWQKRNGPSSHE